MNCYDCPRNCGIDRAKTLGYCKEKDKIRVSKVIENFKWEEPCISGDKGALAIFFSGCNLRCEFCQNYDISHEGKGEYYLPEEFANFLKSFDMTKYSSIDLITPTHFSSLLAIAFENFESPIPVVWNSSGYEKEETIEKIANFVDVFLPDFKYYSQELSQKYSGAKNYFPVALAAIKKMREMKKQNIFDGQLLTEGVLIRHLVLPGQTEDSKKVLDAIKENISMPLISIMSQFTPTGRGDFERKIYPLEYKLVLYYAEKIGLTDGYFQDFDSADDCFIPEF